METRAQEDMIRVFNTSCSEICDGSVELMNYRISPGRYYYWMSDIDGRYHGLDDAILDELCPGKFRIRQIDILHQELSFGSLADTSMTGFDGVGSISFSSLGKREMSLFLGLDKEINHLNYYFRAQFSTDGGENWNSSLQFHQKIIRDATGREHVYYLINFPRSTQDQENIIVNIFQRRTESKSSPPIFNVTRGYLESKVFEEYAFEVGVNENLRIRSTISNEIAGKDGYIDLQIQGGLEPYVCTWEDGTIGTFRKNLESGAYEVLVSDKKNCTERAKFFILAPEGTANAGDFTLTPISNSSRYQLQINDLYRQPIDLIFNSSDSTQVKRFQINPLYEDLNIELDLSFLVSGEYRATLSTAGFSKNISVKID